MLDIATGMATAYLCVLLIHGYSVGVFDAGSTGTRLNIYTFEGEYVKDVVSHKHQNGLHEMPLHKVRGAVDYLIRESQIDRSTPLWFYGTAGIRSLSPARQTALLTEVRGALAGYNLQEAAALDASMEGAYMLKAFEYLSPPHPSFIIVDMGGMSVQLIKKDDDGVQIESYDLGITKSRCGNSSMTLNYLAAAPPCTTCVQCPAGFRESALMDAFDDSCNTQLYTAYCKQSQCILEHFRNNDLRPAKATCHGHTTFLSSYMHDLFAEYGKALSLADLTNIFKATCGSALSDKCRQIYYSIILLEHLGFCDDEKLYPLQKIGGMDLTWSLGRAVDIRDAHCGQHD